MAQLEKQTDNQIDYIDIDYEINRPATDPWTTHTRSFIEKNQYAVENSYRMWLQSKKYDYLRQPDFGGPLENMNQKYPFNQEGEVAVHDMIVEKTQENWPSLTLLRCDVKADIPNRKWEIKVVILDNVTKLPVTTGHSVENNEIAQF